MATVALIACLFCVPQLRVEPTPTDVGRAVEIVASAAGVPVTVAIDGAAERAIGMTGADGHLGFVPERSGMHVFAATVDGVRCLVPVPVRPARNAWLLAVAGVPLGLALLWINLRALLGRRGAGDQASTRST